MLIMAALSVSGASAIYYSSRSQATAEFAAEKDNTTNLAESGMNFARSLLWEVVDTGGDPTDPSVLPSENNPATTTVNGETISYYGVYDSGTSTWTLVGEATASNPSGTGLVERAVETKVSVSPGTPQTVWIWGWSFSKPDSCVTFQNNVDYTQPIKIDGDLCMENSAKITGDFVEVSGTLDQRNSSSIGTPSDGVDYVNIVGGCDAGAHACNPNAPWNDNVYADEYRTDPFGTSKPALDWPTMYSSADLGPASPCTTGSFTPGSIGGGFDNNGSVDSSLGTVDLTPTSSYTCRSATGEISWNNSTSTLTVDGVIFIDGDVQLARNVRAVYQGRATIYVNGDLDLTNQFEFCGISACDDTWDTYVNAVIFAVSGDFGLSQNTIFQGGAVVDGDYSIQNNAENYGPVIATNFSIENSGDTFIPITGAMPGLPSFGDTTTLPVGPQLTNVDFSYRSYTPGAGSDPNS